MGNFIWEIFIKIYLLMGITYKNLFTYGTYLWDLLICYNYSWNIFIFCVTITYGKFLFYMLQLLIKIYLLMGLTYKNLFTHGKFLFFCVTITYRKFLFYNYNHYFVQNCVSWTLFLKFLEKFTHIFFKIFFLKKI